ncbi:MAG: penicillin-binding transpeptidase domain-containing protein [Lachnospiraceae bacterium]
MFKNLKDSFITMVTSRLFVLILVFLSLFGILLYRVFTLQIVNGEMFFNDFKLSIRKEKSIPSTRGNIYDCNGELIAYNELAYSVTLEDVYESGKDKNTNLNTTIRKLIKLIEQNGDKIVNDFNIKIDEDGNYAFTVKEKQLLRFLADIYGHASLDKLTYAEKTATPDEVMDYLGDRKKFGIGTYRNPEDRKSFQIGEGYTKLERLKVTCIRYAMNANSYQKYIPITVATDVSDQTVAVVMENSTSLEGVSIAEDTIRKYVDSVYFSHIIGYTGKISTDELTELQLEDDSYDMNDMIGKAGIEQVMETKLQGKKGSKVVYVDNAGKTIETSNQIDPVAGSDLYLTIDKNLQKAVYNIIEQKLAGILVSKILNIKEYIPAENADASKIKIPIDDVYFALFNNNVLDIASLSKQNATVTEKEVYQAFLQKQEQVCATLKQELTELSTPYQKLDPEYQVYESYIVSLLSNENNGILMNSKIDVDDPTYIAWKKEETISLQEFLNHAIAMNWIDVTKIDLDSQYSDSTEIYQKLLDYIFDELQHNMEFSRKLYKYMIKENAISGKQICLLLWEQNLIDVSPMEIDKLKNGKTAPYDFMIERIKNLDITPAQLALDPYSGSCVVTNVNTGEVLAMVTYPSYDNNRLANSIDSDYYNQLQADLSLPLWDYATQQLSAPGSTFKMVSAAAAMQEGVTGIFDTVNCTGTYDKLTDPFKCWNKSGHGAMNLSAAIENSCNYYFYEMGYRLSLDASGAYNSEIGLKKLAKYADQFGLSEPSGIEIAESTPHVSDEYAVPSVIGQGTNNFTTVGLARYVTAVANSGICFNLSLLDKLTDADGSLIEEYTPEIRNHIDLSSSTWNAIHSGMRKVVEHKKYYEDVAVNVAGKTGTAQENKKRANHALFVGYAPYEAPEVSIATRIAFGYTSDYAAEISRDVMKYYFNLEDEESLITGNAAIPDAQGFSTD